MTNLVVNQRPGETTNEQTVKEGESRRKKGESRRKKGERRKWKKSVIYIHILSSLSLSPIPTPARCTLAYVSAHGRG